MFNDITVTYGTFTFDLGTLPESTLVAMVRKGISHYLGNEQASKVSTWTKARAESDLGAANDVEVATFKADTQAAAVKAMHDGTVGASVRGPRGSSLDTEIKKIATREIMDLLKQHGISAPKKAADAVQFPNGDAFTMAQLVERRLAKFGARIEDEAKAAMAMAARRAEREAAEAAASGSAGVDSLGL